MIFMLSDPVMLLLGLATHYLLILSDMSSSRDKAVSPVAYLKERPYKAALSAIGAVVAYSMIAGNEVEPYIVFGCGYMANDALDRIGSITAKRMQR